MNARRAVILVVVAALIGGGVVLAVTRDSGDGEDIYLEGAGQTGANPFTTVAVRRCADGFVLGTIGGREGCVPDTTTTALDGSTTTALYGGSGSQKRCDPEALIAFLESHPDKAKAWVQGQNEDPTLSWSGGNHLTVADIPTFIRELTPTFLTQDTRVTNHGYVNGKATPHQSVLQKGTAVLVDRNGIPRARCACGNPLGRPHKVRNPHYKGHCWRGCHDRPYCAPPGCSETTTTTESTTTTTCAQKPSTAVAAVPDPCSSTTTSHPTTQTTKRRPSAVTTSTTTTTTTTPPSTTTSTSTTTTTIRGQGTSSSTSTTVGGKP